MEKIYVDFNSQVRKILTDSINKYLEGGLDIRSASTMFINNFNSFLNNPAQMPIALYMLSVMYLDAYKVYAYKQKNSILTDGEEDFLGLLIDIEDSDDLLSEASDPNFLLQLIMSSYEFSEYNALAKVTMIKSLSGRENDWLNNRFNMHEQDINHYDIDITLDFLIKHAKRHINSQKKLGYEFYDGIVINIVGFIRNLVMSRRTESTRLLLELIKVDYAASKFLVDKVTDNEDFIDHIDLYENYSVDDMLSALVNSQAFLSDAVWMLFALNIFKEYDGIDIDNEIVKSKSTDEFNKKLIFE